MIYRSEFIRKETTHFTAKALRNFFLQIPIGTIERNGSRKGRIDSCYRYLRFDAVLEIQIQRVASNYKVPCILSHCRIYKKEIIHFFSVVT